MNIVFWILQILVALFFLAGGAMKLTQPVERLSKSKRMEWVNDIPVSLLRFIGLAEILGAIGLILPAVTGVVPWLTPLAATGLALVMLLAAWFHTRRTEYNSVITNVVVLGLAAVVALGRFVVIPF